MKHLKKFNELKSDTYKKAAAGLKRFGYEDRSKNLIEWSKKAENEERLTSWKERIKEFSPFGTFKLDIETSKVKQKKFSDNFLINFKFDADSFTSQIEKWKHHGRNSQNFRGYFVFVVGVIPTTEETLNKCKNNFSYTEFNNGYFNAWTIKIPFEVKGGLVSIKSFLLTDADEDKIYISDRPSAGRFRNLLRNIFLNPNFNYPSGFTDDPYLYHKMEHLICAEYGFSSDYGFNIEDIGKFINTISANEIYSRSFKEDDGWGGGYDYYDEDGDEDFFPNEEDLEDLGEGEAEPDEVPLPNHNGYGYYPRNPEELEQQRREWEEARRRYREEHPHPDIPDDFDHIFFNH